MAGTDTAEDWRRTSSNWESTIVIQGILRHSDVSTTGKHYIKTVPQMATDAMQTLASQIQWGNRRATARFAR
jgi:integrase